MAGKQNKKMNKSEDTLEDIGTQDWPMLGELEETRFSLKNKKKKSAALSQSLMAVKELTDKEDIEISNQKLIDEKLVEDFLETRPLVAKQIVPVIEEVSSGANDNVVMLKPEVNGATVAKEENKIIARVEQPAPKAIARPSPVVNNNEEDSEDVSRLIAIGLAKIYINKTDSILNPLRFIINNAKQIMVALFQFIVPGIIAWYLINNVPSIATELAKEATHIKAVYASIFYFACLFLWITGQVMVSGFWNMLKYTATNLAKEGKN